MDFQLGVAPVRELTHFAACKPAKLRVDAVGRGARLNHNSQGAPQRSEPVEAADWEWDFRTTVAALIAEAAKGCANITT